MEATVSRAVLPLRGYRPILQRSGLPDGSGRDDATACVLVGAIDARDIHVPVPANVTPVERLTMRTGRRCLISSLALVLPSHLRAEAFGVALVEACRAGKPMITCELGTGTSFVNRNGVTGVVVPPADSARLAVAMAGLWSDRVRAAEYGAAARRHDDERPSRRTDGQQLP